MKIIQRRWKLILFAFVIGIIVQVTYTSSPQMPVTSFVEIGESTILSDAEDHEMSSSLTKASNVPIVLVSVLIISLALLDRRQKFMHFLSSVFYQSNYFRKNIITSP